MSEQALADADAAERLYAGQVAIQAHGSAAPDAVALAAHIRRLVAEVETLGNWGKELNEKLIACEDGCEKEMLPVVAERDQLRARVATLEAELALWKPLTPEEAEKALDEAEAVPLPPERIAEIVKRATDPSERITNSEQAQLAARVAELEGALKPFAEYTDYRGSEMPDEARIDPYTDRITVGDCRRAAELLKRSE